MPYQEQGSGISFRFIRDGLRGWYVVAVRTRPPARTWQSPDFRTREEAQDWADDLQARENDD